MYVSTKVTSWIQSTLSHPEGKIIVSNFSCVFLQTLSSDTYIQMQRNKYNLTCEITLVSKCITFMVTIYQNMIITFICCAISLYRKILIPANSRSYNESLMCSWFTVCHTTNIKVIRRKSHSYPYCRGRAYAIVKSALEFVALSSK